MIEKIFHINSTLSNLMEFLSFSLPPMISDDSRFTLLLVAFLLYFASFLRSFRRYLQKVEDHLLHERGESVMTPSDKNQSLRQRLEEFLSVWIPRRSFELLSNKLFSKAQWVSQRVRAIIIKAYRVVSSTLRSLTKAFKAISFRKHNRKVRGDFEKKIHRGGL